MDVEEIIEDFQHLYYIFLEQDYENEYFDVTFFVDGRELYAHGQTLAAASPVFKEQLLQNRSKRNEPIQIDDFTYDEFFEFLRLIYSYDEDDMGYIPEYDKINVMIELAHIYKIDQIKEQCGYNLLIFDEENAKEAFEYIEIAHKFLSDKDYIQTILGRHFSLYIQSAEFINLDISVIKIIVSYALNAVVQPGDVCKAIYKWGEHQAMVTEEMPKEEKNQLISHYIKDIFLLFTSDNKNLKCLLEFGLTTGILSADEANKYKTVHVTIKSDNKSITGSFVDDYGIFGYIESYKDCIFINHGEKYARISCKSYKIPSKPSTVEKMKGCDWYLLFDVNGSFRIKHQSLVKKTDYLLAEMKSEDDEEFSITKKFDISVTVSRNEKVICL